MKILMAAIALAAAAIAADSQQSTPAQQRPAFEAATIKLAAPTNAPPVPIGPVAPNRLRIPSRTLRQLIYMAYGGGGFNTDMSVRGGPDWATKTAFFIEGVASERATATEMRLMLRTLLEDRFKLKIRDATAEQPPGDIEGIELYSGPSSTPMQFASSDGKTCGTVVIWSRPPGER